jgi:splicing factor 3A subunit 1
VAFVGIIDKTASHIAKSPSPQLLEDKIRESQKADPKFSFLRDSDPFNRYYRYMIEKIKEDGEEAALAGSTGTGTTEDNPESANPNAVGKENEEERRSREEALKRAKRVEKLEEPRAFDFLVELPNVTAIDL